MKNNIYSIVIVISLVFLVGCVSENAVSDNTEDSTSMNISLAGIEKVTVSTQMTDPKQDIVIESEKVDDLLKKLNSYSLKQIVDDERKGWQYLIKIEKKEDEITLISFRGDNKVVVDDILYEVSDYNSDDFLYLFK